MWWAAISVLWAASGISPAQTATRVNPKADLQALQAAFAEVADAMRPSVVAIRAERRLRAAPDGDGGPGGGAVLTRLLPSVGSGVVIREDGMILTNEHVVRDAEKICVVLHDGSSHEAVAVHADPRSDLAVVEIDVEGLRPARLGDVSRVRQGHWAFAMGNPLGLAGDGGMVMSQGIVSAVGQKLHLDPTETRYYGNLIQTSAAINPGNSGGPLVNIDAEVIGITTAISTRSGANEGIGFAVPMEARTKAIIEKLLHGEPVEYGYIGVGVRTAPREGPCASSAGGGAVITVIEPGSPADRAKLAVGDVILEFDGHAVEDADHFVRLVGAAAINRPAGIGYCRGGRRDRTYVVVGCRSGSRGGAASRLSWRGMMVSELTRDLRRRFAIPAGADGLVVVQVAANSPAERAGIRPGQRIVGVGDVAVDSLARFGGVMPGLTGAVRLTLSDQRMIELPSP